MIDTKEFKDLVTNTVREVLRDDRAASVDIYYEEKRCGDYGRCVELCPRVRITMKD